MTEEQYWKNLQSPSGQIDVVLDTDAYNEIDDQFAISYLLLNPQKFCVRGICAAPFLNEKSVSPEDGMNKSYDEILKLLRLVGRESMAAQVMRGSACYLPDEQTPVASDAADFLVETARAYEPGRPLYIIAIGAITNVASAILKEPQMKENCVVVWLGGHSAEIPNAAGEFNMIQDIAAARVIFGCGVPVIQIPCLGVADRFATSKYELEHWLSDRNALCDYLCENAICEAESYAKGKPWTRVIWDVTAVAWLLNGEKGWMRDKLMPAPIPEYDGNYGINHDRHLIRCVWQIDRDAVFEDLFRVLGKSETADGT